jgi:hypothetical protein
MEMYLNSNVMFLEGNIEQQKEKLQYSPLILLKKDGVYWRNMSYTADGQALTSCNNYILQYLTDK